MMIKEFNYMLETINKKVGVQVPLPTITKRALLTSSIAAAGVGTTLVVAGLAVSSKWCILAGGLSLTSSILQKRESDRF